MYLEHLLGTTRLLGVSVDKNQSVSEGHMGWIPGPGRSHPPWGNKPHGVCHNY